jgi:signal transduction histidine kinase
MALLIFGPTASRHRRTLESAARALGEGRTDVRADDSGGDEVSALSSTFNTMASDLEARAAALAESDRARRQLLADVSHELMTPLAAIRGYIETLGMQELKLDDGTAAEYLEIADEETHKLEAIIGDLLDLARLEGGGDTLDSDAVLVDDLLRRVADRHPPGPDRARRHAHDDSEEGYAVDLGRCGSTGAGAAERGGQRDSATRPTMAPSACARSRQAIG